MPLDFSHHLYINFPNGTIYRIHDGNQSGVADATTSPSYSSATPVVVTYPGLKATSIDTTRTIEENSLTVTVLFNDTVLPLLRTLLPSAAALDQTHFRYSIAGANGTRDVLNGKASQIKVTDSEISLTLYSYSSLLGAKKAFRLGRTCRNAMYDSNCTLNRTLPAFRGVDTVTAITTDRTSFTITNNAIIPGFYTEGFVSFTIGNAQARPMVFDVAYNSNNTFYLFERLPSNVIVGSSLEVFLGCAKTEEACKAYNNFVNFGGVPTGKNWLQGSMAFMASTKNEREAN